MIVQLTIIVWKFFSLCEWFIYFLLNYDIYLLCSYSYSTLMNCLLNFNIICCLYLYSYSPSSHPHLRSIRMDIFHVLFVWFHLFILSPPGDFHPFVTFMYVYKYGKYKYGKYKYGKTHTKREEGGGHHQNLKNHEKSQLIMFYFFTLKIQLW